MKTGSLVNEIYTRGVTTVTPKVGMGATIISWTDRQAATIIEVGHLGVNREAKYIVIQEDKANRVDGQWKRGNESKGFMGLCKDIGYEPGAPAYYQLLKLGWIPQIQMTDAQQYVYEPDPNGAKHEVSKRKDGRWKVVKQNTSVLVGQRDHHYDYSF